MSRRPSFNGDIGGFKRRNERPIPRTKYQDIMRRLVTRYIHQTKKQRRQDGVNEDDLLEIKQDISSLRYEIREDRIRETKITENRLDSLRCDILFALRNGYHDNHKIRPPPYGLASSIQNTQNTQNNHNQPIEFVHTVHTQVPSESSTATAQNEDQQYVSSNRDQILYKADVNQRPSNYSVTRVANYISHLGDSFSSQMTDTFPPIHHISDNPSPAYDTDAHAQYSREHSPNYSVIRPVVLRAKDNEEIVNKAQSSSDNKLLTRKDVESIKLEILSALKTEIQDTAKEVASDILNLSTSGSILPTISSELYQTHLYTQL